MLYRLPKKNMGSSIWRSNRINRQTKYIAHYLIILCTCIVKSYDSVSLLRSKDDLKYQINKQITENSHLTLVCPENIEKKSRIEWFKDKEFLNSSFRNNMGYGEEEPHLTIDAYNSLYILHATKREEGTYACVVEGEYLLKYNVKIVSKSKLLNEDFIRFSIYLGFVLSLTLSCYCVGICLAWHRRASFADPLNLFKEKPRRDF